MKLLTTKFNPHSPKLVQQALRKAAAVKGAPLLGLILAGALLGACSMFEEDRIALACPSALMVAGAESTAAYQDGSGRDLTDIRFEAALTNVASVCKYQLDDDGNPTSVVANVVVELTAARGPADVENVAAFEYFVALADSDRRVLAKKIYPVQIPFQGNSTRAVLVDKDPPVTVTIPLADERPGSSYLIYVGLQLSRDEMRANKDRKNLLIQ